VDREKLVVFMLTGPENPRRCVTPFLVAMAALASDWDVSMYFACDGVLLLKRGLAETVYVMEGGRPLSEFMRQAMDLGAKLYGCSPALQLHHMTPADFIEGIESAGAASLLDETRSAATVLTI
jgi:hypothetical protein